MYNDKGGYEVRKYEGSVYISLFLNNIFYLDGQGNRWSFSVHHNASISNLSHATYYNDPTIVKDFTYSTLKISIAIKILLSLYLTWTLDPQKWYNSIAIA
jgi:hypothetical protein